MTIKQYIELWACARDVPREEIEHLGRDRFVWPAQSWPLGSMAKSGWTARGDIITASRKGGK